MHNFYLYVGTYYIIYVDILKVYVKGFRINKGKLRKNLIYPFNKNNYLSIQLCTLLSSLTTIFYNCV